MTKKQKPVFVQTALIGLVGSFLTVCGGLSGALVTSAVTIYQVKHDAQQVEVASSGGQQTLSVDTGTIFLSRQDAAALDSQDYYIDFERAFALHRPLSGWSALEELSLEEQLAETNVTCAVACDQPVFRIRYGQPMEVESDRATTVNGHTLPDDYLNLSEQLYGPPPWKAPYYSQMILNLYSKDVAGSFGVNNLADLILTVTQYQAGRHNRMIAAQDSHFAILQGSSTLDGIRIAGEPGTMTLDDWLLCAESDSAYYIVEIIYTTQSGQSVQIWDDLQTYIDDFRIIQ
jgi:hypothetical protein